MYNEMAGIVIKVGASQWIDRVRFLGHINCRFVSVCVWTLPLKGDSDWWKLYRKNAKKFYKHNAR